MHRHCAQHTLEDGGVLAGGGSNGKLVQSQDVTASLDDAGTSTLGDAEGGNGQLGDSGEADIIRHSADNDHGLAGGGGSKAASTPKKD
jgi:hypothetical protein